MPDYGQPIENDLNFNSLLDFFKAKEASVDVDKDDDMGEKKGGVAGSRKGGQGGWPKKQNYGNPKPTPITPTPKKPVNKAADEDDKGKLRGNPETYIGDTPGYTQQEQADKAAMMSPPTERRFHNRLQGQGVGEEYFHIRRRRLTKSCFTAQRFW